MENQIEDKRFALLIDSENISSEYLKYIIEELKNYGIITIKRIYGDWTGPNTKKWKTELLENSLQPMQQFSYTKGKNATDSFMIIDAMDILYSDNVEGFCLVTSDSDFTRLASRLRESGKTVIGMGETKTPKAFISACDRFVNLKVISGKQQDEKDKKQILNIAKIEEAILEILNENEGKGKAMTDIGEIGSRLQKKYPDFDVRNYGYSQFNVFLDKCFKSVRLIRRNNSILLENASKEGWNVEEAIWDIIKENNNKIELGLLGQELKKKNPLFQVKDYGFSQLKKFVKSFDSLRLTTEKETNKTFVTHKQG